MNFVVSVVVRTSQREAFLKRALTSINQQSFKDYELVIVNDGGSERALQQVLAQFPALETKTKVVHHSQQLGRWKAANAGAKKAKGKYIVFHDDDDTWEKKFLEKSLDYLEENKGTPFRGVSSYTYLIKEEQQGDHFIQISKEDYNSWQRAVSLNRMMAQISIHFGSFVFERALFDELGYFNDTLPMLGDWEFLIRFMSHYEIGVLPLFLANYHLRPQGTPAGNSVMSEKERHGMTDQYLRNEYLRKAIAEHPAMIGLLVNINPLFAFLSGSISKLQSNVQRNNDLLEHIKNQLTLLDEKLGKIK